MVASSTFRIFLATADRTDALGQAIAPWLRPGDTILLSGTLGTGKSQLSRAIIRTRLGRMEEVPSPSFTLVQTYEAPGGEIWHSDLYRLTHPDEAIELGLDEAFDTAICLVEWPDRLGDMAPEGAIRIELSHEGEGRSARLTVPGRADLVAALAGFAA